MKILTACQVRCHECGTTRHLGLGQVTLENLQCAYDRSHGIELVAENVDVVDAGVAV